MSDDTADLMVEIQNSLNDPNRLNARYDVRLETNNTAKRDSQGNVEIVYEFGATAITRLKASIVAVEEEGIADGTATYSDTDIDSADLCISADDNPFDPAVSRFGSLSDKQ